MINVAPRRPGPLRWLAYAYGAGLPPEYREWVLHDVTTRTWQIRHFFRAVAQLTPLLVVLYLVLPGPAWARGCAVLGGALIGLFYSMAYMYESAEHRTLKAGYPRGTSKRVREEADAEERAEREARYAARWRRDETT
ncbi:MAG TPA: DUF5313 family protein [Pseudonocardia sp.]|jgi:hypothetical protein|uniref:DUF5313 family protein n=1 Tax=Pseudonocardia sp. TaxID=60912 RepID=UPI002B4B4071|nr:DUF5313 family protein [Pseudonocardia sp.]HLU57337.1 DUF5313 family protein [Pseudonocardia sp.]